jgi:hypothetical protein
MVNNKDTIKLYATNRRLYAFIDETGTSNFAWMKANQIYEFNNFKPFNISKTGSEWNMEIKDQEGFIFGLKEDKFLAFLIGRFNHIFELKSLTGSQNLSLLSTQTLSELNKKHENILHPIHYKPHILIQWEDKIKDTCVIGKTIRIGSNVQIAVTETNKNEITLSAKVLSPGIIQVNDTIYCDI